jgi:tetratricopeptide (TPR) repeat protein
MIETAVEPIPQQTAERNGQPHEPTPASEPAVAPAPVILEQGQRLSQSILWRLQRRYFEGRGVEAWSKGDVPHYITTNPHIASAYAQVVLGWLRDCREQGIDRTQPVYFVELGSGAGRFGFHFLKKFEQLHRRSSLRDIRVTYVMTDFTERNLDFWKNHSQLQAWVQAGRLDFARFDAENDAVLRLVHSGTAVGAPTNPNPMAVLANYVLDSIPQDAFQVKEGKLHESLLTVSAPPDVDAEDPKSLEKLTLSYEHRPIDDGYYGEAIYDEILAGYRDRLPESIVVFPRAAADCLRNLARLSAGRLLFLSADKGYTREDSLAGLGEPGMAVHGSFSLMVNYHALGQVIGKLGGQVLQPLHRHNSIGIGAFLLGSAGESGNETPFAETRLAFHQAIESFGPDDFFMLRREIEGEGKEIGVEESLAYLRLSGWDSNVLLGCYRGLIEKLSAAPETLRQEAHWALQHVWDNYYSIGEELDIPFLIGSLYFGMQYYPEAIEHFQRSFERRGPEAVTFKNLGLCYYHLRQMDRAQEYTDMALALDPNLAAGRTMRILIESERARTLRPQESD